jgi:hypothetical protein
MASTILLFVGVKDGEPAVIKQLLVASWPTWPLLFLDQPKQPRDGFRILVYFKGILSKSDKSSYKRTTFSASDLVTLRLVELTKGSGKFVKFIPPRNRS